MISLESLQQLMPTRSWAMLLWGGLALVTLGLMVLMGTRWGQARPLSKCVALSLLAHFIFGAYAYGTKLFLPVPQPEPEPPPIQIRLLEQAEPRERRPEEPQPWNQLVETAMEAEVDAGQVERAELAEPDAPPRAAAAAPQTLAMEVSSQPLPDAPRPTPALPDSPIAQTRIGPAALAAAELEATELEIAVKPDAPRDTALTFQGPPRQELPDQLPAAPRIPSQDDAEDLLADQGSRLQRLDAEAVDLEQGDIRIDPLDALPSTPFPSPGAGASQPAVPGPLATAEVIAETPDPATAAKPARQDTRADRQQAEQALAGAPPRRLGDGKQLPDVYKLRLSSHRRAAARQFGGDQTTEHAVDLALRWLVAQQETDGRWRAARFGAGQEQEVLGHNRSGAGSEADTGITGLAVLALLAAGHSHYEGEYRQTVQRGLEFLLGQQGTDGSLAGNARFFAQMYCHGMAFLALSEAYAMTGDQRLKPFVERALEFSLRSQHPTLGGWRYRVGDQGDMSQFGWQVMALKSAELAGFTIPQEARTRMVGFLQRAAQGPAGGLAAYRPGERVSPAMTAESLVCRYFLGLKPSAAQLSEATTEILQGRPAAGERPNLYLWYYGTLALFQAQGEAWEDWNEDLKRELVGRQRTDGAWAGSWDTDTVWGGYGGRIYTTAMATLSLQVYYRYLPMLK